MKQTLAKKERQAIFKLFTEKDKLKFNEIEKAIKIRSNMVAYHLEKLQKEQIIEKKGEYYSLTKNAEPYLSIGSELNPLPIVLVALMNNEKILLMKRNKRPYKDYWGLIGGKMLLNESFQETSLRLIKTKSGINGKFESINSIMHERVEGDDIIKHSFILFLTQISTDETKFRTSEYGELKWFNLNELKNIIPSDLWLIKNKLNKNMDIKNAYMHENQGRLTSFTLQH